MDLYHRFYYWTASKLTFKKFQQYNKIGVLPYDCSSEIKSLRKRYMWMHDGEASVICVGQYLKINEIPFYCIIDEKAREIAKEKNLSTTGTIGLMLWEAEKGKLNKSDLQRMKKKLQESPFRISEKILNELDI